MEVVASEMALSSADNACDGDRTLRVRDHQICRCERIELVVEGHHGFAGFTGARRAGVDRIAVEFGAIEGVHGLREFGHDVVREVDDVVFRIETD